MITKKESDAREHREIEDALTFMLLCERGFGASDLNFFDGSVAGLRRNFDAISHSICGLTARRFDYSALAMSLPSVHGGMILSGVDSGHLFNLTAAHEMDFLAKKRLAMIGRRFIFDDASGRHIDIPVDISTRIIELRSVGISESGQAELLTRNHYSYQSNAKKFFPLVPERLFDRDDSYESIAFGMGVVWAAYIQKEWRVYIRFGENRPGISLPTDPTGVKDFFRFRDIPDGKSRRDALVHWVSSHWRQNRVDPDVENYVREQLRGKREFAWHGLNVQILLPQIDSLKIDALKEDRVRLKKSQLDKRIREYRGGSR